MQRPFLTLLIILALAACSDGLEPSHDHRHYASAQSALTEIIVDNADSGASTVAGSFSNATAATEHYGSMSLYATTGGTIDTFRFTPSLPSAATYSVYAWNSCYSDRATDVPHRIYDGVSQTYVVDVDQDCDTGSHGEWFHLGDYALSPGAYLEITDDGIQSSSPYFGADAVRFTTGGGGTGGGGGAGGSAAGGAGGTAATTTTTTAGSGGAGGAGGSSTGAGGAAGGAGGSGGAPVTFGFEPFNGVTLDGWTLANTSMFTSGVSTGRLRFDVASSCATYPFCAWFEGTEGPIAYRQITGDFTATVLVRPRSQSSPDVPPSGGYQLAGLIARDGTTTNENYVLTVSGYRGSYLSNEIKSTTENSSTMSGPALADQSTADLELRLCRVGQAFHMFRRDIGVTSWTHAGSYDRTSTPLGSTLQVGPIAYTYDSPSDLRADFDYVNIVSGGCAP